MKPILVLFILAGQFPAATLASSPKVDLVRVLDGGIQPQAQAGADGTVHLLFFKGDPAGGDLFYASKAPGRARFSAPMRVNSIPKSAVATGSVRGAHLALGRRGRVHVAWMGSKPEPSSGKIPMYHARMRNNGSGFEPERNVIRSAFGLDGGGSLAADDKGNVYVAWHAGSEGEPESKRRVWMAHSGDEGATFSAEKPAGTGRAGACGCCGMKAMADSQRRLYLIYRAAEKELNRDTMLLWSVDDGRSFQERKLDLWQAQVCPMTTSSMAAAERGVRGAWENQGRIFFADLNPQAGKHAAAAGENCKHPSLAVAPGGETLLAWTEGTAWMRGGSLAWQVFDGRGRPATAKNQLPGAIPTWSYPAVVHGKEGFTIFY